MIFLLAGLLDLFYSDVTALLQFFLEIVMAVDKDEVVLKVSLIERACIQQALKNQRAMLVRSRSKEIVGSEVYLIRSKEISAVDFILERV